VDALIQQLGLAAILADPDACKEATTAEFDQSNPDRIRVDMTSILSGNTTIKDVTIYWDFYLPNSA